MKSTLIPGRSATTSLASSRPSICGKATSGAFPFTPGREERIKAPCQGFRVHAATAVDHLHADVLAQFTGGKPRYRGTFNQDIGRLDRQQTDPAQRFTGMSGQVHNGV